MSIGQAVGGIVRTARQKWYVEPHPVGLAAKINIKRSVVGQPNRNFFIFAFVLHRKPMRQAPFTQADFEPDTHGNGKVVLQRHICFRIQRKTRPSDAVRRAEVVNGPCAVVQHAVDVHIVGVIPGKPIGDAIPAVFAAGHTVCGKQDGNAIGKGIV